jgi:site-specific DNA recombinase
MEKLDSLVLSALADKVLTPDRLKSMLVEMKRHLKQLRSSEDESLRVLQKELGELEQATNRLYESVEKDLLPMDENAAR